jgi:flagellar hook-length control protein FliK
MKIDPVSALRMSDVRANGTPSVPGSTGFFALVAGLDLAEAPVAPPPEGLSAPADPGVTLPDTLLPPDIGLLVDQGFPVPPQTPTAWRIAVTLDEPAPAVIPAADTVARPEPGTDAADAPVAMTGAPDIPRRAPDLPAAMPAGPRAVLPPAAPLASPMTVPVAAAQTAQPIPQVAPGPVAPATRGLMTTPMPEAAMPAQTPPMPARSGAPPQPQRGVSTWIKGTMPPEAPQGSVEASVAAVPGARLHASDPAKADHLQTAVAAVGTRTAQAPDQPATRARAPFDRQAILPTSASSGAALRDPANQGLQSSLARMPGTSAVVQVLAHPLQHADPGLPPAPAQTAETKAGTPGPTAAGLPQAERPAPSLADPLATRGAGSGTADPAPATDKAALRPPAQTVPPPAKTAMPAATVKAAPVAIPAVLPAVQSGMVTNPQATLPSRDVTPQPALRATLAGQLSLPETIPADVADSPPQPDRGMSIRPVTQPDSADFADELPAVPAGPRPEAPQTRTDTIRTTESRFPHPTQAATDSPMLPPTQPVDVPARWAIAMARVADLHERLPPAPAATHPATPTANRKAPLALPALVPLGDTTQEPGAVAQMAGAGALPSPLDLPTGMDGTQGLRVEHAATPASVDLPPPRTATADRPVPPVPQQIADAIRQSTRTQIDLTLSPDELGRVTLSFQPEGDGVRVHLVTERPETLELLRRHIPELAAELRAAGYDTASFSFGRQGQAPREAPDTGSGNPADPDPSDPAPPRPARAAAGALDLRL